MLGLKKSIFSTFLVLLVLPFAGFAATPFPLGSGSGGTTTGAPFPIPISWNVSLNNGIYTYVYSVAAITDPNQANGNYPYQLFLQMDPSITAANFSSVVTNLTISNAGLTSTNIGTFNVSGSAPTYYGALFNVSSYVGLTLSFNSAAAPVYGNLFVNGTWQGLDGGPATVFQSGGTNIFPTLGAVAVPEPSTWALMASCVGMIGLLNFYTKRRTVKTV